MEAKKVRKVREVRETGTERAIRMKRTVWSPAIRRAVRQRFVAEREEREVKK